jgi:adenosylcobinamide-phosphate synthase
VKSYFLLPASYLADQLAGDPEWFPHPVRLIGWMIAKGETLLNHPSRSDSARFLNGAVLTATVVGASYFSTRYLIAAAYRWSKPVGALVEVGLGWTCLAARNLQDEASLVVSALECEDLTLARSRVARIVGRDTDTLNVYEVSRAVIETLAESASDGVIAPLFYMSLGGVPLAMAYKAVNTLDSMIGHKDARYLHFGKAAARLDDAANYLPSRFTAIAIIGAAWVLNARPRDAWTMWMRDGTKHDSPNAGQPESAMSGALRVRLGGGNFYQGDFVPAEKMGDEYQDPHPVNARKAIRIVSTAALIGLGAGMLLNRMIRSRNRSWGSRS